MKKLVRRGLHTYGDLLIIATITAVFGVLTAIGVSADVTFDTNYYNYNGEEGVTIIGFNNLSDGETVVIPAEIDGKSVLAIGLYGVVTTARIPGAEKIGALDFTQATNLKVIERDAFYACSNITGTIESDMVEYIGYRAFRDCGNITELNLPAVECIRNGAFQYCGNITELNLPAVEYIEDWAFDHCGNITELNLPAVEYIGYNAFQYCRNITELHLPPVVEYIGCSAFYGTSVDKSKISEICPWYLDDDDYEPVFTNV